MISTQGESRFGSAPLRSTVRRRSDLLTRTLAALAFAACAWAPPAAAQFLQVEGVPFTDVFAVRVVGDTILAGTDTSVFVSTNAGATWRGSRRPAVDAKTIDAVLLRGHRLFAGTFGTGVFVSDDLGVTWQSFNQGLVGGFLDSQLSVDDLETRSDSLYAATAGAGVWVRKLTGNDTWHPFGNAFETNQASNVNDLATDGTRLLASAGDNGTTFRRDPGAADWTETLLGNIALRPGSEAVTAIFTGSRWVVGATDGVYTSVKGEEPWAPSSTRFPGSHGTGFAQIGSTLFAAFDVLSSILFEQSADGGTTWSLIERVDGAFTYQLAAHGADLYAARSDGLFVRTVATASVGDPPGAGSLHLALAGPQPIRDSARFRFELPAAGSARLELFDVSGRKVAEPIDATLTAGPHDLGLSARGLPAGVYSARLTAGTAHESVRVVRVP